MGRGRVGVARKREPASRDALFRQGGAAGVVSGELGQVKTGAAELPGGGRLARCFPVTRLRLLEAPLRVGGELCFGGGGSARA